MSEDNTKNIGNDTDFKEKILNLRIAVERSLETLKKFEIAGTDQDANNALWAMSAIWNGKEYSAIEAALREKGYKSSLETSMERMGVI